MEGSVFEQLPALKEVDLTGTECIDQTFKGVNEIRGIAKTVNASCGFDKSRTQIACERIQSSDVCNMKTYTTIRDITYTVSNPYDGQVTKLDLSDNRNIEFLPISPLESFPNIVRYDAARCSIKEILKRNFAGLVILLYVHLQENQIRAISSDTFEELTKLQTVDLSKFRILA